MRIDARHWMAAGVGALGLHAAAVLVLFQTPSHPAVSAGGGGAQVMLASVAGPSAAHAPAGPQQDAAEVTPSQTVAAATPPVEIPARPTAQSVERPKAEAAPEVAPPPPVEKARPDPVEAVRPEPVPPPLPEVAQVPAPEPLKVRPPEPQTVEARDLQPPPTPRIRPEPPKRVTAPRPGETKAAEAPPAAGPVSAASEVQGQAGSQSSGGQPSRSTNTGAPAQVANSSGGVADYMSQLRAWLEQHKEYPSRARRRRIEGTALLVFVMDRDGRVLSHRIERSAGDASLDTAVEEMIERAQPLPAIPDSFQQARLEVRVPVQFLLR